jgi:hypothetical protein
LSFYYREVPALALSPNHLSLRKKSDIVFCDKPRGPCAGIIDQPPLTPAAVNKGSLRWHHRPATPRLTAPARHRRRFSTLGGPEWVPSSRGASPPWRFAPSGTPPRRRGPPLVTRGAQPVGLLDKAVKRTPLVLLRPEEDDEDNPPRPELQQEDADDPQKQV